MTAKTVLVAWEFGGGLGHLVPMKSVVQMLRENGHNVTLAVRDLSSVHTLFGDLGVEYLQSPVKTTLSPNRIDPLRTFAHILNNGGHADCDEARALVGAWRSLLKLVRPDLVLCDHSPTSLLAARSTGVPAVVIGTGFCCPPDVYPMPDFRPWMEDASDRLQADEDRILRNINQVLDSLKAEPLDQLSQMFRDAEATLLTTFPELDHYPIRADGEYFGIWQSPGGAPAQWPEGGGKRVFAYIKPFAGLPNLLEVLNQLHSPTIVYINHLDPRLKQKYESATLTFQSERLDLVDVGRTCDMAVLNAGHWTTAAMLLAGKPLLTIPLNVEQILTGQMVERMGAGLTVTVNRPDLVSSKLISVLDSEDYAESARGFAANHRDFGMDGALERIVERIEDVMSRSS
jgi:UDP-N-acetylglucosamine:LPS N-acetylglucosamine transferase